MQNKQEGNHEIIKILRENKAILPYMFWDNAMSINNIGKTPEIIERQEEGYFSSLANALLSALDDKRLNKDISINEIEKLHYDCASRTQNLNKGTVPGEIRGEGQRYAYTSGDITFNDSFIESLIEDAELFGAMNLIENYEYGIGIIPGLDELISNQNDIKELLRKKEIVISKIIFDNTAKKDKSYKIIDELINIYHQNMKLAHSDDDKIKVIIKFVRPLQRFHPFRDANGRVMFMLLLNRELIKNGMLPLIPDNPNDIDICSTEDALTLIKRGQERFKEVVIDKKIAKEDIEYTNIRYGTSGVLARAWHEQADIISSAEDFLDNTESYAIHQSFFSVKAPDVVENTQNLDAEKTPKN